MQIKTTMRHHLHLLEWLLSKRQALLSESKDMKKREPLCTFGGNVNWCSYLENCMEVSKKKIKNRLPSVQFSSVAQFSSVQSCPTLCDPMDCSMPGLPVHRQLPEFTQTHMLWVGKPSNHLILCRPLLLPPSIFPSVRVFSNVSVLQIRWPKYWSFSFNISPSNEHPGLISFRMDWLDLWAVQGTLKSLLQQHSSKASVLVLIFIIQLSHPYMTTGKTFN